MKKTVLLIVSLVFILWTADHSFAQAGSRKPPPGSGGSSGQAKPRTPPPSGGGSSSGGSTAGEQSGGSKQGPTRAAPRGSDDKKPTTGRAVERKPTAPPRVIHYPLYWNYGWNYLPYHPYQSRCYPWGYRGLWCDPYIYRRPPPRAYPNQRVVRQVRPGYVRLRVEPGHARVYVDGALVGTAVQFSGLSNHLRLEPGRYILEFRAEGYEPFVVEISVRSGWTSTERVSLRRIRR